jgi:hypothetical protein
MAMAQLRKPTACPKCDGMSILRIMHGYPNEEGWALVQKGEATLGGCFVTEWEADWECQACHHRWFDSDDPVKQEMEQLLAELACMFTAGEIARWTAIGS